MENKITIEQAINNIQVILDNFVGKKQDHIALDLSMTKIREALTPKTEEKE